MGLFGFGRPNIGKLARKGDLEGLLRALDDQDDPRVRLQAAEALGRMGAAAVEPLLAQIETVPRTRGHVALALGMIADPRAVGSLVGLLGDAHGEVRFLAALALGRTGDTGAVEPLCTALADPERDVREAAARALGELGDGRAAVPLTALVEDEDAGVRERATEALGRIANSGAAPPTVPGPDSGGA